jgi:5-methyltetrahydrofolate--homocysteine methyltransferase
MKNNRAVLLDGAMGTQLQARIGSLGKYPELLNLTHSGAVADVHRAYVGCGSEIVFTNTLTASPWRAKQADYDLEAVIGAAVANAKSSGAEKVALDIGPLGKLLEPTGEYDPKEAYGEFAAVVALGVSTGIDLVFVETMSDVSECVLAVRAVKENSDLPVFVCMTFTAQGSSYMGCTPETFAAEMNAAGADAIGFNCTITPLEGYDIFRRLKSATSLPLIVKPNQLDDPAAFAAAMRQYIDEGAAFVGGCCGTAPEHIAALKTMLDERNRKI